MIEVRTYEFEREHGKRPSGRGHWAFIDSRKAESEDYLQHVRWFVGLYSEAKREAIKSFVADGVLSIDVCS